MSKYKKLQHQIFLWVVDSHASGYLKDNEYNLDVYSLLHRYHSIFHNYRNISNQNVKIQDFTGRDRKSEMCE